MQMQQKQRQRQQWIATDISSGRRFWVEFERTVPHNDE